jgi:hypothetical protein
MIREGEQITEQQTSGYHFGLLHLPVYLSSSQLSRLPPDESHPHHQCYLTTEVFVIGMLQIKLTLNVS